MPVILLDGDLITADGQMQYKNYLLGDDEITFLDAINGWEELPGVSSGNADKPASHGSWSGNKFAGERIITWEGRFAPDRTVWVDALRELRKTLCLPTGTEEYEIAVRLHEETLIAYGAVTARSLPGDSQFATYGAKLVIQFTCSDPRRYMPNENLWSLAFPEVVEHGLIYPLSYDLDYGVTVLPPDGVLVNEGNVLTPVTMVIQGPVVNPSIYNQTLGVRISFNISLADGETLTVDTRTGTVLLNGIADRLFTRTSDSAPILSFGLSPGENEISTGASEWDAPANITFAWRDAIL